MKRLSRRAFLYLTASGVSCCGLSSRAESGGAPARRPNILFCLADDWGWPHAGAYGDKVVQTPAFDALAREGVLFQHAYVSSPSCSPCRNTLLTGQQFYRLGEGANLHSTLDVRHPNFMFMLRESGYQIGHWRKAWGPGDYRPGGYQGSPCGPESPFDRFMREREPGKPFCFWFGTSDPHRPYDRDSGRRSGIDIDAVHVPAFYPDTEEVRGDLADYYFEVQRWDRDVGEAIGLLRQAGELENTVIVMTGDHGMPFPRCKGNLYDGGVRVPLAVRWGEAVKPGRVVTDFVSFTDLAPTFLELAGVDVPEAMTGRSLLPLLKGGEQGRVEPGRDAIVFGRERHVPAQAMPSMVGYPSRAIRTDRWLLIRNFEPDRWPAGVPSGGTHPMDVHADCDNGPTKSLLVTRREEFQTSYDLCFAKRPDLELYDCEADPDQVRNLAGDPDHAGTVDALRKRLEAYLASTADPRFTDEPVRFDAYPFRAPYIRQRLMEHGHDFDPTR